MAVETDDKPQSKRARLAMLHPSVPLLVAGDRGGGLNVVFANKAIKTKMSQKKLFCLCKEMPADFLLVVCAPDHTLYSELHGFN